MTERPLLVVAHGTRDPAGRQAIDDLVSEVRRALGASHPDVPVRLGFLERASPSVEDAAVAGERSVVVPLFLARGFHVRTDLPQRLAHRAPDATLTAPIGMGDTIRCSLRQRLAALSRGRPGVGAVLASAGSSHHRARGEVTALAAALEDDLAMPVLAAFLTGEGATVAKASHALRRLGRSRLVGGVHLLAPGHFLDQARRTLAEHGVTELTSPLAQDPTVPAAVVRRYRRAVAAHPRAG